MHVGTICMWVSMHAYVHALRVQRITWSVVPQNSSSALWLWWWLWLLRQGLSGLGLIRKTTMAN